MSDSLKKVYYHAVDYIPSIAKQWMNFSNQKFLSKMYFVDSFRQTLILFHVNVQNVKLTAHRIHYLLPFSSSCKVHSIRPILQKFVILPGRPQNWKNGKKSAAPPSNSICCLQSVHKRTISTILDTYNKNNSRSSPTINTYFLFY